MKRKLLSITAISALVCIALLLFATASVAAAHLAGYTLPWWTVDSGGGDSSGGGYSLSGTIGQPDAGALTGGNYRLEGGFWGGTGVAVAFQQVFLPLTTK